MIFLYDIILSIVFLPAVILLLIFNRGRIRKNSFYRWHERFGFWNFAKIKRDGRPLLWFHCASLGEVKAIEPLVRKLDKYSILITVMTFSGHRYAEENKMSSMVFYLPVDFSFIAGKVVKRVNPDVLILVETELWPGLLHAAHKNNIKIISINGRLSVYSYPYYRLLKPIWERTLRKLEIASVRTNEDADRFIGLGCPIERIKVTGNIKYDAFFHMPEITKQTLGFKESDIVWVAGSTREGEEALLAGVWKKLNTLNPNLKLVIAPRHIDRTQTIAETLSNSGIEYHLWTENNGTENSAGCIILDVFGELNKYYAVCDFAFVGGSLVNNGGQNPIEPAALGKPVIFGVYMQNFAEEEHILEYFEGAVKVGGVEELEQAVGRLISDKDYRLRTGNNARRAVENQKGAVDKTIEIIRKVAIKN